MKVLFLGPPGVGKSSHAQFLKSKFNFSYLSTGELLRKEIKEGTNFGHLAASYINKGNFVPDDVIIQVILDKISHTNDLNFILDGFPRNINQAESLAKTNFIFDAVLLFCAPQQTLIDRLSKRSFIEQRSDDANLDTIRHRLNLYNDITAPLIGYYNSLDLVKEIDASGSLAEVNTKIEQIITTYL
jgi:adenylate kinase